MKLPLREPISPRNVYFNPKTNRIHLLMPIMSGSEIGLDNTCKSVYSLQEFFGLLGANQQSTAVGTLEDYKAALEFDLKYMPASEEKALKEQRLQQIMTYLSILKQIQQNKLITKPLLQAFPLYPEPLEILMQAVDANLHSIILRPKVQDNMLRTTAIAPAFSANHDHIENGQVIPQASLLGDTLRQRYQSVSFTPKSQEALIAHIVSSRTGLPVDFVAIKDQLITEIETYLGIKVSFEQTQSNQAHRAAGSTPSVPMNQPYLDEQLAIDGDNPATTEAYVKGLIQYCTPNLFDNVEGSPFYAVHNNEQLSILTQFFLAELNIASSAQSITAANFGQILETDAQLIKDLAQAVKDALEHSAPVEEALIKYVNQHKDRFELKNLIPEDSIPTLKERFKSHWEQIKASPHFDEFMLLSDTPGYFVTHQNYIATHFANFLQTGFFDEVKNPSTQAFLQAMQQDFDTMDKPDNVVPHKNDRINTAVKEVDIDLSTMDKAALQALYEDINTYSEALKKSLLTQFKQERPDFKPQINIKQFLQHVAYGQQAEAEALLEKDPELAQALLRATDIPFTDYSGRTFKCTAYEYAYWAKDTHMQRMLEKHIRQDEEIRLDILHRVKAIEEPMNPLAASGFLAPPRPKGLCYTTKDKAGNIINHREVHFDLTPLISALKHYVPESNKIKNKTEADWERLDKIWVEMVGMAQRMVPAHIAHEYCHPDRSFEDITKNIALLDASNPTNLKRQLKFYNGETGNDDVWFTPNSHAADSGLGFSIGIFRGTGVGRGEVPGGRWGVEADEAMLDSAALTAIDEVRTNDCKQSLNNLNQPLTVQTSPTHGT
jgi:hypothetical protein